MIKNSSHMPGGLLLKVWEHTVDVVPFSGSNPLSGTTGQTLTLDPMPSGTLLVWAAAKLNTKFSGSNGMTSVSCSLGDLEDVDGLLLASDLCLGTPTTGTYGVLGGRGVDISANGTSSLRYETGMRPVARFTPNGGDMFSLAQGSITFKIGFLDLNDLDKA